MDEILTIMGKFKNEIFRNQESGFSIFTLDIDDSKEVVCLGKIQSLVNIYNTTISLTGYYKQNEKGLQFYFQKYNFIAPDVNSIVSILKSGLIKGLNYKRATKIAEEVIKNNIDIFDYFGSSTKFDQLSTIVPLIKPYKDEILEKMSSMLSFKKMFSIISNAGGTYAQTVRLVEKYENAYTTLNTDVYKIGYFLEMDFKVCDNLAKYFNYSIIDPRRVNGILSYAMNQIEEKGHCYSSLHLFNQCVKCIQKKGTYKIIDNSYFLLGLIENDRIGYQIVDTDEKMQIYFIKTRAKEKNLAKNIKRILTSSEKLPFDESYIDTLENDLNIIYAPEQRASFNVLNSTGIKVITGGPGTGKTTTINGLIKAYKYFNPDKIIKLAAPTGRAAQRMYESTKMPAETFHRMLEYKPYDGGVCKFSNNNPYPADCYIFDEMSMADLDIVSMLFDAIDNNKLIILVGDVNQIKSVKAGNILDDIIDSNILDVFELKTIYRQSDIDNKISSIIENALKINNNNLDFIEDEHFIIKNISADEFNISILNSLIEEKYQFFSPVKQGTFGIITINDYVQSYIHNEINTNIPSVTYGLYTFCLNDKIIALRNNYEKNYFNGDTGYVSKITSDGIVITFDGGEDIFIKNSELHEIMLAYAITVHKSQGSEYKNIAIILPSSIAKSLLTKNILYTAITRAKNKVYILNIDNGIEKCITNPLNKTKRKTNLKLYLQKNIA